MDSQEFCVNCLQPFLSPQEKMKSISYPDQNHVTINKSFNIGSVLSCIYNLRSVKVADACCTPCAIVLSNLYKFYLQFEQLRQLDSDLSKAIKLTCDFVDQQQNVECTVERNILKPGQIISPSCPPISIPYPYVRLERLKYEQEKRQEKTVREEESENVNSSDTQFNDEDEVAEVKSEVDSNEDDGDRDYNFEMDCSPNWNDSDSDSNSFESDSSHEEQDFKITHNLEPDSKDQELIHQPKRYKTKLKVPKRKPPTKESITCPICQITFEGTCKSLGLHRKSVHPGQNYPCPFCDRTFSRINPYKYHVKTHEDPPVCNLCGKRFSIKSGLDLHFKIVHQKIQPFLCAHCGQRFSRSSHFKSHLKIHSDDKPHECLTCHKSFRHLRGLKEHELRHEGTKSWLCSLCGKGFTTRKYLTNHSAIHKQERRHKCQVEDCGKAFKVVAALKLHAKVHREGKVDGRKGRKRTKSKVDREKGRK